MHVPFYSNTRGFDEIALRAVRRLTGYALVYHNPWTLDWKGSVHAVEACYRSIDWRCGRLRAVRSVRGHRRRLSGLVQSGGVHRPWRSHRIRIGLRVRTNENNYDQRGIVIATSEWWDPAFCAGSVQTSPSLAGECRHYGSRLLTNYINKLTLSLDIG